MPSPPGWSISDSMQFVAGGLYLTIWDSAIYTPSSESEPESEPSHSKISRHLHFGFVLTTRSDGERSFCTRLAPGSNTGLENGSPSLESYIHDASRAIQDGALRYILVGQLNPKAVGLLQIIIKGIPACCRASSRTPHLSGPVSAPAGSGDVDQRSQSRCPCLCWAFTVLQSLRDSGDIQYTCIEDVEEEVEEHRMMLVDDRRRGLTRYGIVSWLESCFGSDN
ncbi:hypothetical protein K474DRAFT_1667856, partial [Panus rudis PR-1116 ss-1]